MKIFAERLPELRHEKKLSMKTLADKLNTTDAAISNWENKINEPKITYLKIIAIYFGVSTDYLLGLEDYTANHLRFFFILHYSLLFLHST